LWPLVVFKPSGADMTMKEMEQIFDDLRWLFHEPAAEFARSAATRLDSLAVGDIGDDRAAALATLPLAEAATSIAHALNHMVGIMEVIASELVTK
jgi:alkyl hydroperoxide reductase subunit AhpF